MAFPDNDERSPDATASDADNPGRDANRDPLTAEPGAHPVGVGVGAAGAGAVGALIGAVAGPVGLLVGSVVGAVAGAVVGKSAAEAVNPTEPAALAETRETTTATEEETRSDPGSLERNILPASPLGMMTTDTGLPFMGSLGAPDFLATQAASANTLDRDDVPRPTWERRPSPSTADLETAPAAIAASFPEPMAEPPLTTHHSPLTNVTPFPEPMAEPSPPPSSRLHRIVLAERRAESAPTPPPLEVTAQTAYPEHNVREAAYFRYLERQRTGQSDDELDDWTAAEREVLRG